MATLAEVLEARTTLAAPELVESIDRNRLRCYACGHECPIPDGAAGVCKVRFNRGGVLRVPYGLRRRHPVRSDREEALLPRASRSARLQLRDARLRPPLLVLPELGDVAGAPRPAGCRATERCLPRRARRRRGAPARASVVSTYNEPLITSEWAVAVFKAARARGLLTAFVSNGNGTPQRARLPAAVDRSLQGRSQELRRSALSSARRTPRSDPRHDSTAARHGHLARDRDAPHSRASTIRSDEIDRLTRFVAGVSRDIPWHVTAFHKDYRMTRSREHDTGDAGASRGDRAAERHPLRLCRERAGAGGILENTYCHQCRALLIERHGYHVQRYRLTASGQCPECATSIPGRWGTEFGGQITERPFLPR